MTLRSTSRQKSIHLMVTAIALLICLSLCGGIFLRWQANVHETTCIDNLRRLGQALRQYVSDYDDTWPTSEAWTKRRITSERIPPCPAAPSLPKLSPPLPDGGIAGYAYNQFVSGEQGCRSANANLCSVTTARIAFPKQTIAVFDYIRGLPLAYQLNPYPTPFTFPPALEKGWLRHHNGGNYLFVDGHVGWYEEKAIQVPATENCHSGGNRPTFCIE